MMENSELEHQCMLWLQRHNNNNPPQAIKEYAKAHGFGKLMYSLGTNCVYLSAHDDPDSGPGAGPCTKDYVNNYSYDDDIEQQMHHYSKITYIVVRTFGNIMHSNRSSCLHIMEDNGNINLDRFWVPIRNYIKNMSDSAEMYDLFLFRDLTVINQKMDIRPFFN